MEETPVPDVRLEGSPLVEDLHNLDFYDNEHFHDEYQENEFIDTYQAQVPQTKKMMLMRKAMKVIVERKMVTNYEECQDTTSK